MTQYFSAVLKATYGRPSAEPLLTPRGSILTSGLKLDRSGGARAYEIELWLGISRRMKETRRAIQQEESVFCADEDGETWIEPDLFQSFGHEILEQRKEA